MTTTITVEPPAMVLALSASFGNLAQWRADFVATAEALGGGRGRLLLSFVTSEGRLVHQAVADGTEAPAASVPVLAVDLPAAASAQDTIAWPEVYERYQHAVHNSSDSLAADPQQLDQALVLDVRRAAPFQQAKSMLPGAQWHDPAQVDAWAASLPRDREVVVYCVYGHEVGRSTAMRLRAAGVNARFLPGGIDAWAQSGRPLQTKEADS
jgi:Fe-Mn family superoxide dismutase